MLSTNYGGLVPEDESLTHQIVDTFATVSQSDPSWTEKIWTIAHARDNSLQLVLGVGKYTNRGVFDGAGGVCRGTEQWTVRAGRRLSSDPSGTDVGPVHYRVVEPLKAVRVTLDKTEHAPIAFDVTVRGSFDAALEDPWPDRSPDGYRVSHNVLRYHQIGVASGWVEVEGERTEVTPATWISIRDHSWGLRPGVGKPIPGLPRGGRRINQMLMTWCPMTMVRPDGSAYSLFVFFQQERGEGFEATRFQAEQQNEDGTAYRFAAVDQDLHFEDGNRRLTHGTITLTETDGSTRPLTITAAGPTGFHLGTAGYYGWNDWVYGQWVGELKVEGYHVPDCDQPEIARQVHQLRDLLVRVEDPAGGGVGLGNAETFALGAFPERGLSAENSFL
ncbi:hypothetical protein Mkiyose1665_44890 [Mycobacterium kiyosense]|uniref:AttH domain-containing protein n=1 Tax=Mycobacterium kiyosense TaxID=2871094 RepID=A0A9P3Q7R5_9MYCO|nr:MULTISPECIES: hypothetical protein [Mycobacterium]BDE14774.1 hypothetical protein MKCMC460_36340 [Mycobacterium sp. 20KCMC460]GLB84236.1 hypothetical protein SRL2020028_34920 [Mycobacterium kiyosense]GLB96762.1 hypothetical protein SRL2020226_35380 [Mycobacterium kiyosense]GLC01424.1 hypothetical protein SRL2020400_20150 [Mycobacterium kiyosense]GLC10053.1 hypothetical protein SRL2020411_46990 [Mycobacterium kiyosense]